MKLVFGGYEYPDDDDNDRDPADQNPTGRKRKSSARTRRKKDRRLFGGTRWGKDEDKG